MGKLIKNIHRQFKYSIKYPPNNGPITGPARRPNVHADKALLLFFSENISTTIAWLNATRPAPKKPWKVLNSNKYSIEGDRPQRLEEIVKPNTP